MKHTMTRFTSLVLAVIMVLSMAVFPVSADVNYTDVSSSDWYAEAVNYVTEKGYMNGVDDGVFDPNGKVTRAMFVTVLARLAYAEVDNSVSPFDDVPANQWYSGAVAWAAENGIVNGVSSTQFAPNRNITRQDLCTILGRFVAAMRYGVNASDSPEFTDTASVAKYAKYGVALAGALKLINGFEDGSFRPKGTASRAQVAAVMMRLDEALAGQNKAPVPMPEQNFRVVAEDGTVVTVDAPEGALPEGTEMTVTAVGSESLVSALQYVTGATVLRAMDITFTCDGIVVEPVRPVSVRIALGGVEVNGIINVIHMDDDGNLENIGQVEVETSGALAQSVTFRGSDFSLYAVVDETQIKTIKFFDGPNSTEGTEISTQKIKQAYDSQNTLVTGKLYDPGVDLTEDKVFVGWYLSNNGSRVTIDGKTEYNIDVINNYIEANYSSLAQNLEVHAVIKNVVYLVYNDESNRVLKTQAVIYADGEVPTGTVDYGYVPDKKNANFYGWTLTEDSLTVDYENKDTFKVQSGEPVTAVPADYSVELYPVCKEGNWLTFDPYYDQPIEGAGDYEDKSTGSYTPPQFRETGELTERPANPTRDGYDFVNWYEDKDFTKVYAFGEDLTANKTVYAKWTPLTAKYYIVIWQQSRNDTPDNVDVVPDPNPNNLVAKSYDYYNPKSSSYVLEFTATVGSLVNLRDSDKSFGGTTGSEMGYYFTFNSTTSDVNGKRVAGDGSTVLNAYYDRRVITLNFYTNSNKTAYYSFPDKYVEAEDGDYYYGTDTYSTGYYLIGTGPNASYKPASGERVYYHDTYSSSSLPSYDSITKYYSSGMSNHNYSTSNTYTTLSNHPETLVYDRGSFYTNRYRPLYYYYTNQGNTYYQVGTGPNPEAEGTHNKISVSNPMRGLYGAPIPAWPDGETEYYDPDAGSNFYLSEKDSFAMPGAVQATEFDIWLSSGSDDYTCHWMIEALDGSWEQRSTSGISNGTTQYYDNSKFIGFSVYGHNTRYNQTSGSYWTSTEGRTDEISFRCGSYDAYIFFKRNSHVLTFKDGNATVGTPTSVKFGTDLSTYASTDPGTAPEGCYFAGWCSDPGCSQLYNFNQTMPDNDVTLYANWVKLRFRVVLDPSGGESVDPSEIHFEGNQATTFRVNYGEKVEGSSINKAERTGYELIGWFLDEDYTIPFNFDEVVTDDIADMTYGQHLEGETDEQYAAKRRGVDPWNGNRAYDDADGEHDDVVGKVTIYARWRQYMDTTSYIIVEYDAQDGKIQQQQIWDDPLHYADAAQAIAQPASVANEEGYMFQAWEIQDPTAAEGATLATVKPGDTFDVFLAKSEQISDSVYKVTLKAKYYTLSDTHITWVGNGGTNAAGEDVEYSPDAIINSTTHIKAPDTFTNPGRVFLGWARLTEDEVHVHYTDGVMDAYDATSASANPNNIWLRWIADASEEGGGHYQLNSSVDGNPSNTGNPNITFISADEKQPYNIMYAVWSDDPCYYIYHSATAKLETVMITKTDGNVDPVNLKEMVTPGYLYGGYFKNKMNGLNVESYGCGSVTAGPLKEAMAASSAAADKMAAVAMATPYTGDAIKDPKTGVRFFSVANAQTASGLTLTPQPGEVYYIKEVPTKYLVNKMVYTYHSLHGDNLTDFYFMTVVDDSCYEEVGFMVDDDETIQAGALAKKITLEIEGYQEPIVYTLEDFGTDVTRGLLCFREMGEAFVKEHKGTGFQVVPAWKTMDGVIVRKTFTRYTYDDAMSKDSLAAVDTKTLYVKFTDSTTWNVNNTFDWTQAHAVIRLYFYKSGTSSSAWSDPIFKTADGDWYSVEVPIGEWDTVVVVRRPPTSPGATFDGCWCQSGNIVYTDSNNYLHGISEQWDNGSCAWQWDS